jgi:phosphoserine phosphatase
MKNIIAVVFDFDITLCPYYQHKIIFDKWGIEEDQFWKESWDLLKKGYDMEHAYLRNLIDYNKKEGFELNNKKLYEYGKKLELYEGLSKKNNQHSIFDDLENLLKKDEFADANIKIEYYCISGGITEIIEGAFEAHNLNFKEVFACKLDEDENGKLTYIKETVGHTVKTQKLYMISKGISPKRGDNPNKVNEKIEEPRIPFKNMIFLGDGLTDIPAFALLKKNGGIPIAVYREEKNNDGTINEEKTLQNYLKGYQLAIEAKRAEQLLPADYSSGKPLKMALLGYVKQIAKNIVKDLKNN